MIDENGYWQEDTGNDNAPEYSEEQPAPESDPLAPGAQSDTRHTYVGRDARGDVWQILDDGGNVIEWAVTPGATSGAIIPGTAANLGAPSNMTTITPQTPAATPAGNKSPDDPSHRYVGTDASGDLYEMTDPSGRIIRWSVKVNDDSRNMLPGSASVASQPAGSGIAPTPAAPVKPSGDGFPIAPVTAYTPSNSLDDNHGAGRGDPTHVYDGSNSQTGLDYWHVTDAGGSVVRWATKIGDDSRNVIAGTMTSTAPNVYVDLDRGSGVPGCVLLNTPQDLTGSIPGQPKQTDTRHVFVGRDNRGDVWQIFDGTNVIEWVTKAGDESGRAIAGTARNLGPPSAMTKAQNDGTAQAPGPAPVTMIPPPATTATAAGEKSTVLVMVGIAASLLGAFK